MLGGRYGGGMGLRQQQHARTEDAILEAAYRLFAERGYETTTVDMIAAACDISPRTFYRYFATKDALLSVHGFRSVDEALTRIQPGATVRDVAACLVDAIERSLDHERATLTARLLVETPRLVDDIPSWRSRWALHLADGLAALAGRDRASPSDRMRATLAMSVVGVAVDEKLRHGGDPDLRPLVDRAWAELAAGAPGR